MKVKITAFVVSVIVLLMSVPMFAAETNLSAEQKILNSIVLTPDEFLKSGSEDYETEAKAGARSSQRLGETFTIDDAHNLIKSKIDELTDSSMDTYSKVKAIYDWLVYNVEYEFGGYGNFASIYCVLKNKIGVCDDFSYVFSAMCRYLGLNARCIDGYTYSGSGYEYDHIWVEIKIDGKQYIFDPQVQNNILADKGYNNYSRFCKTFDSISKYYKRITDITNLFDETETEQNPQEHSLLLFADVKENSWYFDSVNFVYRYGMMKGVSENTFNPDGTMSRSAFITVLYRIAGTPSVYGSTEAFYDIPEGSWCSEAVKWSVQTGLAKGTGYGKFGTDDALTVEQAVTFLHRFSKIIELGEVAQSNLSSYSDADKLSDWSKEAFMWGDTIGLFKNIPNMNSSLNFERNLTRAECAEMIRVLCLCFFD